MRSKRFIKSKCKEGPDACALDTPPPFPRVSLYGIPSLSNVHPRALAFFVWQRKITGADLMYKKAISLMDALLGFERMLTLLDGRRVPVVHDQVGAWRSSFEPGPE